MADTLASWHDSAAKSAMTDFVTRVTTSGGPDFVPSEERIAVFDNDGTLWCERPMPIELGFILMRLATMAEKEPALRTQQPWTAAHDKDYAWLADVMTSSRAWGAAGLVPKRLQCSDSDHVRWTRSGNRSPHAEGFHRSVS